MSAAATECPKCGHKGANPDQCDRCGIIFDRMHTVLDTRPLGAQLAVAREAYIAQRQAARANTPQKPAPPSIEVSSEARTVLETPRVVANKPGLSGPAGALDRVNPHASTVPAVSPVAGPPPSLERIGVEVVPRTETHPTRNFLLFVAAVALVGYGWNRLQERRQRQLAAATQEVADVAAGEPEAPAALQANDLVQGKPEGVDADYLAIASRALVQDVRHDLGWIKDAAAAGTARDAVVVRLKLLQEQLPDARVTPLQRSAYAHGLEALEAFVHERVARGIDEARAAPAATQPLDDTLLRAAEHQFGQAARAPVRGQPARPEPVPAPAPEPTPAAAPTPAPATP